LIHFYKSTFYTGTTNLFLLTLVCEQLIMEILGQVRPR